MSIDINDIVVPKKTKYPFFFLFSKSGQSYSGGWVKVYAETLEGAKRKFVRRFGIVGFQNGNVICDNILLPEEFCLKGYLIKGYLGAYCHETL